MFALPCQAVELDFIVNADVNAQENLITIYGTLPTQFVFTKDITYYLLYPENTIDDIPQNPDSVANYGQFKASSSGEFSHTIKVSEEGVYNLCIQANKQVKSFEIDTQKDSKGMLWQLHQLGDSFNTRTSTDVKELFEQARAEIPKNGEYEEIPVVEPFPVTGLYNVFVDPENGNDATADGSIDKPFKTCNAALKKFKPQSGMVLTLRGGLYPQSDRIELKNIIATEDAPFIITNYKDETPTFTGGNVLKGEDFKQITDTEILARLNPAVSQNIKVLDMNAYGITNFGEIDTYYTPALWVEGNEYTIARWPNSTSTGMRECTDPDLIDTVNGTARKSNGVIDCGTVTAATGSSCGEYRKYSKRATALNIAASTDENGVVQYKENGELLNIVSEDTGAEFMIEDIHPFSWVDTGDIWIYGSVYEEWRRMNFKIAEFNPETRSIRTAKGNEWGAKYAPNHNQFYYFNVLEELDTPGEWYLDKKSGMLYVYPTEDLTDKEIIYDATPADGAKSYFMHFTTVENVIINGISFKNSRGNGIYVGYSKARHVVVQNCNFSNMHRGVYISGRYSGVINSTFRDLYERGVQLNIPDSNDTLNLIPARQFMMNNILHNTTGMYSGGIGNVVSHNVFSNNRGSAIRPAGNETIVEYNEVVAGPRETMDSGGIYVGGGSAFKRGIHVRYNYVHDIGNVKPHGIYFDDMLSECYAYGNIVDGSNIFMNGTREVTMNNNIVLNSETNYGLHLGRNYYAKKNGGLAIRWKPGSLQYGNMTKPIAPGSQYNFDAYISRYPILAVWIPQMRERIAEFEIDKDEYDSNIYQSETYPGYTDLAGMTYNLNQYLSASRDNQFENNVLINSKEASVGQGNKTEGLVRIVYENNLTYTAAENPFDGENFGDSKAYEKIIADNPDFQAIPFHKIGLTDKRTLENTKTEAIRPANNISNPVPKEGLALEWKYVIGAQRYKAELSDTADFSNILETTTVVENIMSITTPLENDKVYYWRVTTIPDASYVVGDELVSDTFMFKTAKDNSSFNNLGATDIKYTIEDGKTKVRAHIFNSSALTQTADVYVAGFNSENKMTAIDFKQVPLSNNELSEEILFELNSSDFDTIKVFVWLENSLYPATFVRKITK